MRGIYCVLTNDPVLYVVFTLTAMKVNKEKNLKTKQIDCS